MPWPQQRRIIGTKVQRLDGPEKATGRAKYSFDINRPGLLQGRILRSPHAHARIRMLNTANAERAPGVRAVFPMIQQGGQVYFAGEEVVALAADTEEHAEDAIRLIQVQYDVLPHYVTEAATLAAANQARTVPGFNNPLNVRVNHTYATENFDQRAYQGTAARVEGNYGIPVICHQCLESHGLVAEWDADQTHLTVWASTQAVFGVAGALARHFQIAAGNVRCITHYMGGGFGSKFNPGKEGEAAAELAKRARAPVKMMLNREEEIITAGNRPSAYGTIRMAADAQGNLHTFEADVYGTAGVGRAAAARFNELPYVYPVPNVKRRGRIVQTNGGSSRAMRAPGHPQSCVLTEWAFDELAARLNQNPLEMRLRNLPPNDANAVRTSPQSLAALRHTIYTEEIGIARRLSRWDRTWHAPGMGGRGVIKRGIGMALHTWGGAGRGPNDHSVTISSDGSVLVRASTQDLGTAQRTVNAIVVAEVLGLQPNQITVEIGDSQHGRSTGSGGSTTCPSTAPATLNAATAARDELFRLIAGRLNAQQNNLAIEPGRIVDRGNNRNWTWQQACGRLGQDTAVGRGDWNRQDNLSNQGVGGVQVAEVEVDTETGVVRCTRFVAVQDCGMVINKQGCESQVSGGVIMGINAALYEERIMDQQTGRQVNPDMEFYKLANITDIPDIIVHMHDMPARGVIGIGEPPTISTLAAVGNALFNALGVRVSHAPFTPDRVLAALAPRNGGNNE